MTTQEIVKALRYCGEGDTVNCEFCPLQEGTVHACYELYQEAANLTESLSAELEQVKRERDVWKLRAEAAEYDMRKAIMGTGSPCKSCKYPIQDDAPCSVCNCVSRWQWRGPCAENGGAK